MNEKRNRIVTAASFAVALPCFCPSTAWAGWGDEVWGQMVWGGSVPVPLLPGEGALLLGLLVASSGYWLARRVHRRLLAMTTDQHGS